MSEQAVTTPDSFIATRENGAPITVLIHHEMATYCVDSSGETNTVHVQDKLLLEDGTPVSYVSKGRYRAFGVTEEWLTSDAPDAP